MPNLSLAVCQFTFRAESTNASSFKTLSKPQPLTQHTLAAQCTLYVPWFAMSYPVVGTPVLLWIGSAPITIASSSEVGMTSLIDNPI